MHSVWSGRCSGLRYSGGALETKEAFAERLVPLIHDTPFHCTSAGGFAIIATPQLNLAGYQRSGVDLQLGWRVNDGDLAPAGRGGSGVNFLLFYTSHGRRGIDKMGNSRNVGSTTATAPGATSRSYFDLTGRIRLARSLETRAGGSTSPTNSRPNGPANFAIYDVLGRFYVGANVKF